MLRLPLLLAAALVAPAAVPTPESHFGHAMGADRKVLDWERVVSYFQALERNSDRLRLEILGRSTEGRPFIAALIAAPRTLANLERYRWIQQKLADPRRTRPDEAERLFGEGKAVVMITCSIHATEIASTHTAVEFAYKLLSENRPKHRAILENVIFVLVPSLNPDGLDLVTRWYRKTLGTPYEGTAPPELYQKYTGHDNNRDWYFFTQVETRLTVEKLHNVWRPHIVYDVHQMGPSGPRMFVPPWTDPIDPNIDPLIVQQCNAYGMGMALDLTAAGKTGVIVNAMYDFWSPSRHYQAYHGGLRILSESASVRIATPIESAVSATGGGAQPARMSWNYVEPWTGGTWRLRDIVDYQLIAFESILYQAALRREDLLRNFYRIGQRACSRSSPWGFVVPAVQRDPAAAVKLLETLDFGLVEIERVERDFQAGGRRFPAGSYLVRMAQPYSSFAKTLLERQRYPDLRQYPGGPPRRPYDVTAHTLPLLLGVEVIELAEAVNVPYTRVREFRFAHAKPPAEGVLPASDSRSWREVARAWTAGRSVWRERTSGDFRLSPAGPEWVEVPPPRIGLYKSYVPNMDEGWTRWVLDEFGFRYASLHNRDIARGHLRSSLDVVVFPDQPPSVMENGFKYGTMPEEFTGGLDSRAVEALREFAAQGGSLIFFNRAADFASEKFKLPVERALRGISANDFYCPGSLLNARLDDAHPLTYGLPEEIPIWVEHSPAWDVAVGSSARAVVRYPAQQLLASGWLLGEEFLAGKAAVVECPLGQGRVILFGMRPQYRGQSWQAFKLLFNALALAAHRR
ncbi:MAG: M14 family metallopeptidase [Bryobacterales bacterium]|nr:M14 family metallopeptidase [Bryobacteraceae bacterium]MDW8131001.1 M14 family metallopeptidase [Bryobacterales bacterium]